MQASSTQNRGFWGSLHKHSKAYRLQISFKPGQQFFLCNLVPVLRQKTKGCQLPEVALDSSLMITDTYNFQFLFQLFEVRLSFLLSLLLGFLDWFVAIFAFPFGRIARITSSERSRSYAIAVASSILNSEKERLSLNLCSRENLDDEIGYNLFIWW
jgi:hypothetical protein